MCRRARKARSSARGYSCAVRKCDRRMVSRHLAGRCSSSMPEAGPNCDGCSQVRAWQIASTDTAAIAARASPSFARCRSAGHACVERQLPSAARFRRRSPSLFLAKTTCSTRACQLRAARSGSCPIRSREGAGGQLGRSQRPRQGIIWKRICRRCPRIRSGGHCAVMPTRRNEDDHSNEHRGERERPARVHAGRTLERAAPVGDKRDREVNRQEQQNPVQIRLREPRQDLREQCERGKLATIAATIACCARPIGADARESASPQQESAQGRVDSAESRFSLRHAD